MLLDVLTGASSLSVTTEPVEVVGRDAKLITVPGFARAASANCAGVYLFVAPGEFFGAGREPGDGLLGSTLTLGACVPGDAPPPPELEPPPEEPEEEPLPDDPPEELPPPP